MAQQASQAAHEPKADFPERKTSLPRREALLRRRFRPVLRLGQYLDANGKQSVKQLVLMKTT
jgi:hypothetical protein